MARYTDRFGLSILGPGSALQDEGYKFCDADRRLIDRLLQIATENHRHNGATATDNSPGVAPNLTMFSTGGAIASGTRYHYRYTYVDGDGNESAPSPMATIDTPGPIKSPSAPTLSTVNTGGTLRPGGYSYVLSAYKDANTLETKAVNSAFITIVGVATTNKVTLILPAMPAGATGLNVYRKSPTGMHYLWLAAVPNPAPLSTWVDDGTIAGDCDRSVPSGNSTSNTNRIQIALPGATPALPVGSSWRTYRSASANQWDHSYLTEIVPMGATPTVASTYTDIGSATQVGGPPNQTQAVSSPPKIKLTNAAEVQGTLPPGLNVVPLVHRFNIPGPVTVGVGTGTWVCELTQADIIVVRAYLGATSTPATTPVIVDLEALRPAKEGVWTTLFTTTANRSTVPVGQTIGATTVPDKVHLVAGDTLRINVIQAGGGATPTDIDLSVNVAMYTQSGSTTISHVWAPT